MPKNERLEIKRARLRLYLEAEKAILSSQSYELEGLKLTRANLKEVQAQIARLENEVVALSRKNRSRLKFIVAMDRYPDR